MMPEQLTPAHVQAIADEVNAWYARTSFAGSHPHTILWIEHVYELGEVYEVAYEERFVHDLFIRDASGALRPVLGTAYFPPGWTEKTSAEQAERSAYRATE